MTGYGADLKSRLAKKNVNQKQAAEILGVSPAQISRLIAEKAVLNPALAKSIGKNFGPSQKHWLEYLQHDEPEQLSLEDVNASSKNVAQQTEKEPTPDVPKAKSTSGTLESGKEDKHFNGFFERDVGQERVSVKKIGEKGMVVVHESNGPLSKMLLSVFDTNGTPISYRQPFHAKETAGMKKELNAAVKSAAVEPKEPPHMRVPYNRRNSPNAKPTALPSETVEGLEEYLKKGNTVDDTPPT